MAIKRLNLLSISHIMGMDIDYRYGLLPKSVSLDVFLQNIQILYIMYYGLLSMIEETTYDLLCQF